MLRPFVKKIPSALQRLVHRSSAAGLQRSGSGQRREVLLSLIPKESRGAEIGVWKGDFSERILRVVKPRELHLIDPWRFQSELGSRWYGGAVAKNQADMDRIHESVVRRFATDPNVTVHRASSAGLPEILHGVTLDWIYIDGDHSKDAVLSDLELGWGQVRSGGYVAGDDLHWTDEDGCRSVKAAVEEFCARHRTQHRIVDGNQFVIQRP